jgi:hypothetical protein
MAPVVAFYRLHGAVLRVESHTPSVLAIVDGLLRPYRMPIGGPKPFRLILRPGDPASAGDASAVPVFWKGFLPEGQELICRSSPGRRILEMPGLARVDVDSEQREACVIVHPGRTGPVMDGCITPVLCEFLALGGHHVVHAASLVLVRGRRRTAVMLSGASGAGKTTTSLTLTGAGLKLLTDDASFVTLGRSGPRVWGLPARLKVHERTLTLVPWLQQHPRGPGRTADEFSMDPAAMDLGSPHLTAAPGAILFLDPRNDTEHRVEPIDKTSAMARLVRENVRAYESSASGPAGRAFAALAALVRESRTWRVSLCPRLETLYDVIAPLVER